MNFNLPQDHRPFSDKYFLRAKEVLEKENLNPIVKAQVFIRNGNCKVFGINQAVAIITKYSNNVSISALLEGTYFENGDVIMTLEAPIQSIIDLETLYLGVLSAETTKQNDNIDIDLKKIENNMRIIVSLVNDRPVSYFGARHWRYDADASIAHACFQAGAQSCSTDSGAETINQKGIGTIPHALEAIYHWKYGLNRAVVEATKAFDKHMDKAIPRIALIDYANKEIADTLQNVYEIPNLYGVRIDTCGENKMQGCFISFDKEEPFTFGNGVSIFGTTLLRTVLDKKYKIMLSSGFGNPEKVKAFLRAERDLGYTIFDGLGVGGVFTSRMATMDIISVEGQKIHKVGRLPKPTDKLVKVI